MKYTPAGGSIRYFVRQLGPAENGQAVYRCSVKDTGVGMSQEFCQHVFDAFERERNGAEAQTEGSGLGLAITKRLVEEMGGSISCRRPGHPGPARRKAGVGAHHRRHRQRL